MQTPASRTRVHDIGVPASENAFSLSGAMSNVWSVRLLLDDEADKALVDPGVIPFGKSIVRLSVGGWAGAGIDDVPYIAFELQASGFDEAVNTARRLVAGALREQGVKPRRLEVVWAAPVRDASLRGHLFLEQAKELFEAEQYELAIVAAQMHFEAQVLLLMERASERIGAEWAKRLIKYRGVATLSSDVSRATAELLLEIDVTQSRYWPAYKAHRTRRNAVTHEAQPVSEQDARASIEVVQGFWGELAKAERGKTLF